MPLLSGRYTYLPRTPPDRDRPLKMEASATRSMQLHPWACSVYASAPEIFHPTSNSHNFIVETSPPLFRFYLSGGASGIRLLRRVASWARSMSTVVGGDQPSDLLLICQIANADQLSRSDQSENTVSDTCFTAILTIMARQW